MAIILSTYTYAANNYKENNQQTRNGNEEAQVPKWLWQSTSKLLGDDLTFQILNGDSGDDGDVDEKYSPQKVGHFDTQSEEFYTKFRIHSSSLVIMDNPFL